MSAEFPAGSEAAPPPRRVGEGVIAQAFASRREPSGLFRKYASVLLVLMAGGLVVTGLVEMSFNYRESREATAQLQRVQAQAAAVRIEQHLVGIQSQIEEVASLPFASSLLGAHERRDEYRRLMKLVPALVELRGVDANGEERLKVSQVEVDEFESRRNLSTRPAFAAIGTGRIAYGAASFGAGVEPRVELGVRDRDGGGATLALLDLRFVSDLVQRIHVGRAGRVYVVDSADHVVAHTNLGVVLKQTRLTRYAPLAMLRAAGAGMIEAEGLEGGPVMVSAAKIPSVDWLVVVEQPQSEVLGPVYATMWRTVALIGGGLLAALVASYVLARRLARPIVELRRGAEKISRGDFAARIEVKTGDEVEALAREFNFMANQLEDYTTGLERKVREKTAQLELANRHKSEFLANMSHELRTPLNAVIGFSDALREELFGTLNPKQMEYVRDINASGQHLLSLINDILDLSKIEAGRMELDVQRFDVAAALENCRALVRERAHRQGLKLLFDVPADIGAWGGDPRKFKQVVLNLLANAVKFTPNGGEVRLEARRTPSALEIVVEDTGPGIGPEDQERIFEEFTQVGSLGEARHEGTGLGLALARRLVELHGGRIEVTSERGKGARFTARFPPRQPGVRA